MKISHNGQYVLLGDSIYDAKIDTTYNLNETTLDFWLYFFRDNLEHSYNHNIIEFSSIQKIIRETTYKISEIFDFNTQTKFILEFEKKFSSKLIVENENKEENVSSIVSSWNYIIESVTNYLNILTEEEKGFFSKAWDKTKEYAGKSVKWLTDKGISWVMEEIRKLLFSWGGAAAQAIATMTGVGNIVLVAVWGAMLGWDILQGINGNWNWVNIIIDLIGVVTTGPGSKIAIEAFKKLGLIGSKLPLKEIITKLMKSSAGTWIAKMLNTVVKSVGGIISKVTSGINWVATKLGFNTLSQNASRITSNITKVVDDIGTAIKPASTASKTRLNQAGSAIKSALSSKAGQIALPVGLTYAFNPDKRAFAGAFSDNKQQSNQPDVSVEDELAKLVSSDEIEFEI